MLGRSTTPRTMSTGIELRQYRAGCLLRRLRIRNDRLRLRGDDEPCQYLPGASSRSGWQLQLQRRPGCSGAASKPTAGTRQPMLLLLDRQLGRQLHQRHPNVSSRAGQWTLQDVCNNIYIADAGKAIAVNNNYWTFDQITIEDSFYGFDVVSGNDLTVTNCTIREPIYLQSFFGWRQ